MGGAIANRKKKKARRVYVKYDNIHNYTNEMNNTS